jgi:4'-phosphopantetheinyl transferase EntD
MLEQLLPAGVAVAESREDILDAPLFAEEEAIVSRSVEKRRREFTTARACARDALARLGVEPQAIPSSPRGAPQWPDGIVGSITHCDQLCACAVARSAQLLTIGIDAELDAPLPRGVLADIALSQEREQLQALMREEPGLSWDRLLFSAKESVYKAWFPLTQSWLGFEDAELTINREQRSFSARLRVPGPRLGGRQLGGFSGRWLARDGLLLTAIALASGEAAQGSRLGGGEAVSE